MYTYLPLLLYAAANRYRAPSINASRWTDEEEKILESKLLNPLQLRVALIVTHTA
jgi:hypothetical protein